MTTQIDIGVEQALINFTMLREEGRKAAQAIEGIEKKSKDMANGFVNAGSKIGSALDKITKGLKGSDGELTAWGLQAQASAQMAEAALSSVALSSFTTKTKIAGLKGEVGDLGKTLTTLANDQAQLRGFTKLTTSATELSNALVLTKNRISQLSSERGKALASLKLQEAEITKAITAEQRLQASMVASARALQQQNTEAARAAAVNQTRTAALKASQQEDAKQQASLESVERALARLSTEQGKQLAILKAQESALTSFITAETKLQAEMVQSAQALKLQNTETAKATAINQARTAALKASQVEDEKRKAKIQELERSLKSLTTEEGKRLANLKAEEAAAARAATSEARLSAAKTEALEALRNQATEEGKSTAVAKARTAALRAQQQEEEKLASLLAALERRYESLAGGVAERIVRQTELNRVREKEIRNEERAKREASEAATAAKQHTVVKRELTAAEAAYAKELDRTNAELDKLQARAKILSTGRGRELEARKAQVREQAEYNKRLNMSTAALMGFSVATKQTVHPLNLANQSGAALRATMAGMRSSIGMYTSSTVIMASATYAIAAALRSGVEAGTEFEYTMARVQAISAGGLSNSAASAVADGMGEYTRALGMATQYTATEVSGAMNELAMAGYTVGDSMTALRPTLDIATIGQVTMAQAADYATNILAAFNLQATDLSEVVDVLASAITTSNTTFTQLANAVSYVGPAAASAGYSLRETVAAVEVLANVGIKGSRAGTGLRRVITSLQAPSEKGAKILDKYNISVSDMAGNAQTLTSVLGQFHNALMDEAITPLERTRAAVDLVGVRMSQVFLALVTQAEDTKSIADFVEMLENVEGAARRMGETLKDTLKVDWATTKSSFMEAQLTLMESLGPRLSYLASEASVFFSTLNQPADGVNDTITKLDVMVAKITNLAEAGAWLLGTFVAFKASSAVFSVLGNDLTKVGGILTLVATRRAHATTAANAHTASMVREAAAARAARAEMLAASGALAVSTDRLGTAAGKMGKFLSVGGVLIKGLGWVGIAATAVQLAYSAYSMFSDSDVTDDILEQKDKLQELNEAYEENNRLLDLSARKKEASGAARTIAAFEGELDNLATREASIRQAMAVQEDMGVDGLKDRNLSALEAIKVQRRLVEEQIAKVRVKALDLEREISNFGKTRNKLDQLNADYIASVAPKAGNPNELERSRFIGAYREAQNLAGSHTGTSSTLAPDYQDLFGGGGDSKLAELIGSSPAFAFYDSLAERTKEFTASQKEAAKEFVSNWSTEKELLNAEFNEEHIEPLKLSKLDAFEAYELAVKRVTAAQEELDQKEREAQDPSSGIGISLLTSKLKKRNEYTLEQIKAEDKLLDSARKLNEQYNPQIGLLDKLSRSQQIMGVALEKGKVSLEDYRKVLWELSEDYALKILNENKYWKELGALQDSAYTSKLDKQAAAIAEVNRQLALQNVTMQEAANLKTAILYSKDNTIPDAMSEVSASLGRADYGVFSQGMNAVQSGLQGEARIKEKQQELLRQRSQAEFGATAKAGRGFSEIDATLQANLSSATNDQERLDAQKAANEAREEVELEHKQRMAGIDETYLANRQAAEAEADATRLAQSKLANSAAMGMASDVLGLFASASKEASGIQKAAFVAQKALAVAQIIVNTMNAASAADVIDTSGATGEKITAVGYMRAGLVASMAIGELQSGGDSNYSGAYDKGGWIPAGSYGIVGEYAPEFVSGPAHVTSREDTAKLLKGQQQGAPQITLAPQINVTVGEGASEMDEAKGREITHSIKSVVMSTLSEQVRPNGMLDNWIRSRGRA